LQAAAVLAARQGNPFVAMWVFSVADEHVGRFIPSDGLDGEQRPDLRMSSEIRRFFDTIAHQRKRAGQTAPAYAWAAESVSSGERTYHPHVHCLVNIACRKSEFAAFAGNIESTWGWGSVHLEVLRNRQRAASYLLKGVSYSVKGLDGSQGRVWGRRSGVSRGLRHDERRTPYSPPRAADAVKEVASLLRLAGRSSVKTPYGAFSPRGFHPRDGVGPAQVTVAALVACAELREEVNHASVDSESTSKVAHPHEPF
jgi:hypothetical protein